MKMQVSMLGGAPRATRSLGGILIAALYALVLAPSVCTAQVTDVYRDPNMDFGSIQTVAV